MDLHSLHNPAPRKKRKRVGRGNGNNWGRTCGRGEKGQLSRSGSTRRPHFEGGQIPLLRRLPKRGFNHPSGTVFQVVNTGALQKLFEDGDTVNVETLQEKGLINKVGDGVKILGKGNLTKKLSCHAHAYSASARAQIEGAGGTCESL